MAEIPPWALNVYNALPESTQQKVMMFGAKSLQQPYVIPLATIPAAWALAYIPHFLKFQFMATFELFDYNNETPRFTDLKERGYPKWLQGVVQRLYSCHMNGLEIFPFYVSAIVTCFLLKVKAEQVTPVAMRFLALRVLYFVFYLIGINKLFALARTAAWGLSVQAVFDLFGLAFF